MNNEREKELEKILNQSLMLKGFPSLRAHITELEWKALIFAMEKAYLAPISVLKDKLKEESSVFTPSQSKLIDVLIQEVEKYQP